MARSAPALVAVFLLVLALLTLDAAQGQQPFPPTDPSDAEALHAVFRQWRLEGEAAAENPCMKRVWSGSFETNASIDCNCPSWCRITGLNVTGYRNITEIPLALFNLTELISLDLSNNNLNGSIPPEVGNLSKLETWHFNNNNLSGSFPHESSLLRNLKSLWIFDNNVEGLIPEFIQNLTSLTDLRIYGTKLQGPIPKKISNLTNLEVLMLGDLGGNHSYFDVIGEWANLSTLSLRKCGLTGQLPNTPPNLPKLKYLDLTSNNLSGSLRLLLPYKDSSFIYIGENSFSERLPPEIVQQNVSLDVSYNRFVNGSLPTALTGQKWPINYIGTSVDASGTVNSDILTILNCLRMKGCNRSSVTRADHTIFAINCGGKQIDYSDQMPTVFSEDLTDLGGAGFYVNTTSHWVTSHVGSDPFNKSAGIVNIDNILDSDMPELYKTARTSTSSLRYYVVGLANGKYTVKLFFAEIVITDGPGRRLFDIDIQNQNIRKDFDITKEAGGSRKGTNITQEVSVNNSILEIHLYWSGRGTCCIPYKGAYGPLVSAIKVTRSQDPTISPPRAPSSDSARQDEKRRGVVAGIAALCIAAAVISSSVVYLWWKWVSLVKRPMA
ncbi:hypothetical protein BDA96_10G063900 [Sorghum bicolor]|uniref:non-specific serine/threonine protein kinase n=1 Tax=Sorghum bicolor TaxID=4558 RepID=A0A921TZY1_SORBI|nr:probable LRR receptor-like serine/threonine-protein kinase At1g56140 isoform X2 [Sorghum bicolor]KAG0513009.1 hypothetical protein BDA96_10G063900 [Sorghum bicolor]|eukprot:XP_021305077.1 probable LRR receptor-like serine/threonine-protein kinase At1g56140 isoform X2 [Sorghum bicolor]